MNTLLERLKYGEANFKEVLAYIEERYDHVPTAFKNGAQDNAATENQGSAKVFAFAQLNDLSREDTLALFAEHYADVLASPEATNHQNIRQFMTNGWGGITFEGEALLPRK